MDLSSQLFFCWLKLGVRKNHISFNTEIDWLLILSNMFKRLLSSIPATLGIDASFFKRSIEILGSKIQQLPISLDTRRQRSFKCSSQSLKPSEVIPLITSGLQRYETYTVVSLGSMSFGKSLNSIGRSISSVILFRRSLSISAIDSKHFNSQKNMLVDFNKFPFLQSKSIDYNKNKPAFFNQVRDLSNSRYLQPEFKRHYSSNLFKFQIRSFHGTSIVKNNLKLTNIFSRISSKIKHLLVRDTAKVSGFDTVSAFISWLVMGHLLWIILGTSSFGLALLYCIHYFDKLINKANDNNTDPNTNTNFTTDTSFLGWLASSILSHGLGVSIEFQKGKILPQFKDGKLRFNSIKIESLDKIDGKSTLQAYVDQIDMTLSFNKWYEGNGLIFDLNIYGLNGKIYRNKTEMIKFNNTVLKNYHIQDDHYIDYEEMSLDSLKSNNHLIKPTFLDSNYHFDHVKVHDSYCEIYDELSKTPLKITIFSGDFPSVTGNRLILDFFNANNVSGAINDSMFTIHKRQDVDVSNDKVIRFKIDGILMGNVSSRNPSSKFNWLIGGKAQVLADIKFPTEDQILESDYTRISRVLNEIVTDISKITSKDQLAGSENASDDKQLLKGALIAIYHTFSKPEELEPTSPYILVDFKVKFSDLKASLPQTMPTSSSNIPFISLSNLRSLIQFINDEDFGEDTITIKTTVIERLSDLYNIPDISTTKIFDLIVSDIYEDLLKMVKQHEVKIMNEKSHSWSLSIASQLLLFGLGVLV